jgi:hypothetical protein
VSSALTNNRVYKIAHFQFRGDLANEEHTDLSYFRPLHETNSPTSNSLILMEIDVTKGEQSAQLVHM